MYKRIALLLIVFSMVLALVTGCNKKDDFKVNNNTDANSIKLVKDKKDYIDIDLYFDATKDKDKVEISKEQRYIEKQEVIGEIIMQEIIKGPSSKSNCTPILPKTTRLLSFNIANGIAYVNLSDDAKIDMDASKEEACLSGIASSLMQLSSVKKVQIQIENKNIDTLGGHYNISTPFSKDDISSRKKK